MLICFEGADGSGKDTVADAVAKRLGAERLNFPNDDGVTGPLIRSYLRKEWAVGMGERIPRSDAGDGMHDALRGALAFQALQVANRMEVMERLAEARETDRHLVLVRYWASGWVYGQLDGLDPSFLIAIHRAMVHPQYTFLVDADAEVCMARRDARDQAAGPERYEGKLILTKRVVDLYRRLFNSNLTAGMGEHWGILDATQPPDAIVRQVMKILDVLETPLGS